MKIGILTHSLCHNYGGLLQNFALQQILIKCGFSPITLNHYLPEPSRYIKVLSFAKRLFNRFLGGKKPINGFLDSQAYDYIYGNIDKFKDRCIIKTNSVTLKSLRDVSCINELNAIIVGSDQVWRYKMMKSDILEMFLKSFQDLKIRRISYAASFGCDMWEMPDDITLQAAELAKKFDKISVRESDGIRLCSKYLGVVAEHVLDPTLLLDPEDYSVIIESSPIPLQKSVPTLVTYILDANDNKTSIIESIQKRIGLVRKELSPASKYSDVGKKHIDDCVYMSVEEWLKRLRDADMVITDSFHGAVFSIIFNKPFWVIGNEKRGISRFNSLLEMFNLKDRMISVVPNDIYSPINWCKVNMERERLKKKSIDYLLNSLN